MAKGPGRDSPKALDQLKRIRSKLEAEKSAFRAAAEMERSASSFCEAVRAELKQKRKQLKWDQATLANTLDYSQSAISKIESGDGDLSLKMLFRMALALGVRPVVTFIPAVAAVEEDGEVASADAQSNSAALAVQSAQEEMLRRISEVMSEAMVKLAAPEEVTNEEARSERVFEVG